MKTMIIFLILILAMAAAAYFFYRHRKTKRREAAEREADAWIKFYDGYAVQKDEIDEAAWEPLNGQPNPNRFRLH